YLSEEVLRELARREKVPLYRLQGLVSFYPHFRTKLLPRTELSICRDMACWLAGGAECCARLRQALSRQEGIEIHEVSCLGRCDQAPAGAINGTAVSLANEQRVQDWVDCKQAMPAPSPLLPRAWRCDLYGAGAERFGVLRELLRDPAAVGPRVLAAL